MIVRMPLDNVLLRLVREQYFTDQQHLLDALHAEGHEITQPTLSRHLSKLGIQKRNGRYSVATGPGGGPQALAVIPAPPNLIIVRTAPGFANALAVLLDRDPLPNQGGTIAGDDTILIVFTDPERYPQSLEAARERLLQVSTP